MTFSLIAAYVAGFALGAGLIIAIGAQNAFVLRQGLRRSHVFAVALVCSLSDAALIWCGTLAAGYIAEKTTTFATVARYGGAVFLIVYGILSATRALYAGALQTDGAFEASLIKTLAICLSLTFLNPHVYLDTCVLIGSVATQYDPASRIAFALGASTASLVWFFGLAYGARLLTPIFARPVAWRVLDAGIAAIMLTLGVEIGLGG